MVRSSSQRPELSRHLMLSPAHARPDHALGVGPQPAPDAGIPRLFLAPGIRPGHLPPAGDLHPGIRDRLAPGLRVTRAVTGVAG